MAKKILVAVISIVLVSLLAGCAATMEKSAEERFYEGKSQVKIIDNELVEELKSRCLSLLAEENIDDCYLVASSYSSMQLVTLQEDAVVEYSIEGIPAEITTLISQYSIDGGPDAATIEDCLETVRNSSLQLEGNTIVFQ